MTVPGTETIGRQRLSSAGRSAKRRPSAGVRRAERPSLGGTHRACFSRGF